MTLEDVDNYVKHSTPQVYVKPVVKARSKSPIKVEQPEAQAAFESVNPNVYQTKTLSKQQLLKPKAVNIVVGSESTSPGGDWVEIIQTDTTGQPKTVRAWVPHSN